MRRVFLSYDRHEIGRIGEVRDTLLKMGYELECFGPQEIEWAKTQTDNEIRRRIKGMVRNTSVTCVLITDYARCNPWVCYEIERSIRNDNGILGVLIHRIPSHIGDAVMEESDVAQRYAQHTGYAQRVAEAVIKDRKTWGMTTAFFTHMGLSIAMLGRAMGTTLNMGEDYRIYEWMRENGRQNLGDWIEYAAEKVGR